jgi:hypothetical protein
MRRHFSPREREPHGVPAQRIDESSSRRLPRFRDAHGYTDHSAYDLRFPGMGKTAHLAFRIRMRNRQQVTVAHLAPTAKKFASKLNEKDWPLVFVLPFDGRDLSRSPDLRDHEIAQTAHKAPA